MNIDELDPADRAQIEALVLGFLWGALVGSGEEKTTPELLEDIRQMDMVAAAAVALRDIRIANGQRACCALHMIEALLDENSKPSKSIDPTLN